MNVCLRRLFLKSIVITLLFLPAPSLAQNQDLAINGDNVSYEKDKNIVEARGSVEVVYKGVTVTGEHIIYNTETENIKADKGFYLSYSDMSIEGETLDYQIKDRSGVASDIMFDYGGIEIKGHKIELGLEKFKLSDASFTTCDIGNPHYRVTANEISLYPTYGWLVASWGFFWLGPFPILPMPTYIYDMMADERGRKNIPPFPEIGSNDEDGAYVRETLAWHIRRELSGTYSLSFAEKKGFGGGLATDYIVNDNSRGNARLYAGGSDGMFGGGTHQLFFGDEVKGSNPGPFAFLALPKHLKYEFESTVSYRERINYERVTYYPNLVLKSKQANTFWPDVHYDAEAMLGMIAEEGTANVGRGGGIGTIYWQWPEMAVGEITPSASVDSRFYSNGTRWIRTITEIGLTKTFTKHLSLGLGYAHYVTNSGTSPFNFEIYRFNASDRFTSDLSFLIGETGFGVAASYFINSWQPEDIDYLMQIRMHCYDLMLKYRSIRKEFELGFSLAGG